MPSSIKFNCISEEQSHVLLMHVTGKEVKDNFILHPVKSPIIDGLNPAFFLNISEYSGSNVIVLCRKCFDEGELPENVNSTLECEYIFFVLKG